MRWKWLLLLSLISISLVVVSGNDDEKEGDNYDEDNGDTVYDDETPEESDKAEESIVEPSDTDDPQESTSEAPIHEEEESVNEDTVDVENVPIAKQQGKYMSYDDYFVASAMDGSDSNYNWNGKHPTSKST